jgi:hypothetical protein
VDKPYEGVVNSGFTDWYLRTTERSL